MSGGAPFLATQHVFKRFGSTIALRDVSFSLDGGECVALLGGNGAGKTTLLRILATLARPTRGAVLAFGVDAWSARREVRRRIGVVAHQPWVYPELTCRENLDFFATMYEIRDSRVGVDALERVGLAARADDRAGTLSRGLLQRLNLARAILHEPAVLVFDEPDTGLDAGGRGLLGDLIAAQLARGGSVVLTSHATEFAVRHATRVVLLERGTVALDEPARAELATRVESAIVAGGARQGA